MNFKLRSGFTLVEMLISIFLIGSVSALVSTFAVYYFQNYSFSFEENQSIGAAQTALTQVIREVRETRAADNGAYAVNDAQDNSFTFFSDVTNDGRSDRVRYFIENGSLKRGVIEPTVSPVTYLTASEKIKIIVDNIDNNGKALFTYYNGAWPSDTTNNPLPLAQRILNTRFVSVYIRININPGKAAQPFELTSGVAIRSLKDNL
jgi:prepilin-type N-terminal cleavage/methylation domain-containing protein